MEGWLRCKVLPGMFSHEQVVVIEEPSGDEITSLFVDKTLVESEGEPRRKRPVPGRLRVEGTPRGERVNVFLPVACLVHGRVISVSADLFSA